MKLLENKDKMYGLLLTIIIALLAIIANELIHIHIELLLH